MNKTKNGLHLKTSELQARAMDLVQSIDKVNSTLQEWTDAKTSVRELIKQRSQDIQDHVKGIERKLLSQLDAREDEIDIRDEAFAKKKQLHGILRSSLSLVDFLRLLVEYGEVDEVEVYSEVITKREQKLYAGPINVNQKKYDFKIQDSRPLDMLEKLFGSVTATHEEVEVWDPNKPANNVNGDMNGNDNGYDVETNIRSRSYTLPSYSVEKDNEDTLEENVQTESSCINSGARRQVNKPQPRFSRRTIASKSTSFDSGFEPNIYHTHQNQNLSEKMLYGNPTDHNITEFEILNENEAPAYNSKIKQTKLNRSIDKDSFQTAIDSLISSSKVDQPSTQRPRRCSAPSFTIIDTLNRRRLSALSILERANINTDGLTVTTDIESGMNEARQEWMRENLKRKIDRGDSIQEIV